MPEVLSADDMLRLQRHATHLHRLGPRALAEFLAEVAIANDAAPDIFDRLDRYRHLDPQIVTALGADRIPPSPLALVPE